MGVRIWVKSGVITTTTTSIECNSRTTLLVYESNSTFFENQFIRYLAVRVEGQKTRIILKFIIFKLSDETHDILPTPGFTLIKLVQYSPKPGSENQTLKIHACMNHQGASNIFISDNIRARNRITA